MKMKRKEEKKKTNKKIGRLFFLLTENKKHRQDAQIQP